MISYISLFGLSVLMHGKTAAAGGFSPHEAMNAVRAAWAYVETLPRQATTATQSRSARPGDPNIIHEGGTFIVLANSGQSSIEDDDADEDDVDEVDAAPHKGDAASAVGIVRSASIVAPVSYDQDLDGSDAGMAEDEGDEPLIANDINAPTMGAAEEPPSESPDDDDAKESFEADESVDWDDLDETNELDETEEGDFEDFGTSFSMPSGKKSEVTHSNDPVLEPAAGKFSGQEPPPDATAPPVNGGLSGQLRQSIQIARMTLKDQPSELIRVSVNTSMVVNLSGPVDGANIVDPTIADIIVPSPNRVIVVGKSMGTTQLVLTIGQGQAQEHRVFHVYVEPNVVVLSDLIRTLAPRSDVRIGSLNGQLVLQGNVPDAIVAKQIEDLARAYQGRDAINHLSISGTQQTLLRVVVAEVNKEALRNLGFNWAIGASDWSRDFFFANNVAQLNPTMFSSSGLSDVLSGQQLYGVAGVGNGTQTNVTFGFPKAELQVFMNALRTNGLARTLAEPNLVAISGQTATFLAGGEVPIPVSQGGAVAGAITIEYKEFGVRLAFTPTVGADQIIRLHVMSEVSDAVPGSRQIDTIPVFTFRTRRVESTIECPNGKTFAIAGLLNESVNAVANKIPGLGDVPVLGQLFSSVDYQRSNTELVVLVTPNLVEALEPEQVATPPGQMMQHPDDWELFGLGQLEGSAPPSKKKNETGQEEGRGGTLVHRDHSVPVHARLQGNWGMEDQEPSALEE